MGIYNRVIFVAKTGNCRAPMAAAILNDLMQGQRIEILSRGLVVLFPEPINQKAEAVMISNGLDVTGFMSSQLTEEDFTEDTLMITMSSNTRQKILDKFEKADAKRVQVLTEYVGDELEILNPYGGTLQTYGLCYESLYQSLKKLAEILKAQ